MVAAGCSTGFAAAVALLAAAPSSSITARHPWLTFALFLTMQAVILAIFGISELQRRKASPVHICRALELKAKLDKVATVEMESARPSVKPILRMVLIRVAVIWSSRCSMAKPGPSRRKRL